MKNKIDRMKPLLLAIAWISFGCAGAIAAVDFAKDIVPIFQKSCVECHGPEKQKGKLRLDSKEATFKGGEDGAVIVPGQADKSDLYRRVSLPAGHDDIMPNKGDPLTKAQTDLIRDWINGGAVWPDGLVIKGPAGAAPAPVATAITTSPGPKPTAAEVKAVAELAKLGVDAREIAANVNWRQANFRALGSNANAQAFVQLKSIANLTDLNLAGVKLTDADLANLKGLTNLTRLHLEHTAVTDAGLAHLKGLANLTYLNLFDTAITDAGLKQLKGLKNLRNLYVFESKVTDAGVAGLKQALPDTVIDRGWDIKALVQAQEKSEAKSTEKKDEPAPAKKTEKKKKAK